MALNYVVDCIGTVESDRNLTQLRKVFLFPAYTTLVVPVRHTTTISKACGWEIVRVRGRWLTSYDLLPRLGAQLFVRNHLRSATETIDYQD